MVAAALLVASAAAADDQPEVRRAAALLDYVARGYPTAVVDGQVVNAPEFDEQQAFAGEAAEILEGLHPGSAFPAEARALAARIRARERGAEATAASLHQRVLDAYGLTTTPPPDLIAVAAPLFYEESCAACHGAEGRGDGFAAAQLPTRPTDFTGPERAELTPYRVYSAIRWGVPHTAMPAFDGMTEQRRWEIALWVLAFGHSDDDARQGAERARAGGLLPQRGALVAKSDAELRRLFGPADERALIAWVRRIAPFAPPPAAGFQQLRNGLAMVSTTYVHGNWQEAHERLRDAELGGWLPLEPLVRAVAPDRIEAVRAAFAEARGQIAHHASNTRVLGALAQLAKQIAQAGPEELPGRRAQLAAGGFAALWNGLPAALALCAAALLSRRKLALLLAPLGALAAAELALRGWWPWQVDLGAQVACAVALGFACGAMWRRFPQGWPGAAAPAVLAAVLSATSAGGAIASSIAALHFVFPQAPAEFAIGAAGSGAALGLAAWFFARLLAGRRTPSVVALACALVVSGAFVASGAKLASPLRARSAP